MVLLARSQWKRLGGLRNVVGDLHGRLNDFIHRVVVCRRDAAIRGWRDWLREDPLVHPYRWLRPDLVPPAPFLKCEPHISVGGSGVVARSVELTAQWDKILAAGPCYPVTHDDLG